MTHGVALFDSNDGVAAPCGPLRLQLKDAVSLDTIDYNVSYCAMCGGLGELLACAV